MAKETKTVKAVYPTVTPEQVMDDGVYDYQSLAQGLGVSNYKIRKAIQSGQLAAKKMGLKLKVTGTNFKAWIHTGEEITKRVVAPRKKGDAPAGKGGKKAKATPVAEGEPATATA